MPFGESFGEVIGFIVNGSYGVLLTDPRLDRAWGDGFVFELPAWEEEALDAIR